MTRQTMDVDPIPVKIIKEPEESTQLASSLGQTTLVAVPLSGSIIGIGNGVPILQRRPTRYKAVIHVPSLTVSFAALIQLAALGASPATVFNPNAFGVYQTVTGGTVSAIAVNGTTTGLTAGRFYIPAGGTLTVTYTVLPTQYFTTIPGGVSTFPEVVSTGVVFASRLDNLANPNNPIGFLVGAAPYTFQWENQEPLYAVALGAGPVNVSFLDQSELAWQSPAEEGVQEEGLPYEEEAESSGTYYDSTANRY